ncbi:hypothetical protein HK405_013426, partial [Cladochytrium tenue]
MSAPPAPAPRAPPPRLLQLPSAPRPPAVVTFPAAAEAAGAAPVTSPQPPASRRPRFGSSPSLAPPPPLPLPTDAAELQPPDATDAAAAPAGDRLDPPRAGVLPGYIADVRGQRSLPPLRTAPPRQQHQLSEHSTILASHSSHLLPLDTASTTAPATAPLAAPQATSAPTALSANSDLLLPRAPLAPRLSLHSAFTRFAYRLAVHLAESMFGVPPIPPVDDSPNGGSPAPPVLPSCLAFLSRKRRSSVASVAPAQTPPPRKPSGAVLAATAAAAATSGGGPSVAIDEIARELSALGRGSGWRRTSGVPGGGWRPWSSILRFRSPRVEEAYLREILLANRVWVFRVVCVVGIFFALTLFVFYRDGEWFTQPGLVALIWTIMAFALLDLCFVPSMSDIMGSVVGVGVQLYGHLTGFAFSFNEVLLCLAGTATGVTIKAVLIASGPHGLAGAALYLIFPILNVLIVYDTILVGDRDKRI